MDKVQVAHSGIDERLIGRSADTLDDAGPEEAGVVLGVRAGTAPSTARDEYQDADDESMPLAPDATRGDEEASGKADAEQEVACQQRNPSNVDPEEEGEREGIGSEDGAEGRREDGRDGQDEGDEIASPERPVQRVVRVVGGLRHLDERPMLVPCPPMARSRESLSVPGRWVADRWCRI